MQASFVNELTSVSADAWNRLANSANPFIQHDFLLALEQHDCLEPWGWRARHCLIHDDAGELIGACPLYEKTNSYGEFVFDWAWADAYERNGLPYYPKLVCAIPFTPATGPRLLVSKAHPQWSAKAIRQKLIEAISEHAGEQRFSSAHFLFCHDTDMHSLQDAGLLERFDYQFHWRNQGYASFDDFLHALSSKRRKNIRRERRKVMEANIRIERLPGSALSEAQWRQLYAFYQVTFMKKSGAPTLTLDFFRAVAHHLLAILAWQDGKMVAGAICFDSSDCLYGRHWGCLEDYDSLHFEVCYYQGIEHCIEQQRPRFEPGAQGEHKIWRGFLPVKTRSAHWIANEGFRHAIDDFLQREARAMEQHGRLLEASSPYRKTQDPA